MRWGYNLALAADRKKYIIQRKMLSEYDSYYHLMKHVVIRESVLTNSLVLTR